VPTQVRVLGIPQTLARFAAAALAGEVAAREATDALADEVVGLARAYVPVDTGNLQASIQKGEGGVYSDVEYAPFVEYGTSDTPAQPFMRPAADSANDSRALSVAKAIMDRV